MKKKLLILVLFVFVNSTFSEIVNFGKAGDNTNDLLKRINFVIDYHPSCVILMVGTNDFINDRKFVKPDVYKENMHKIVGSFNVPVYVCTIPPADESKGFFTRHNQNSYNKCLDSLVMDCNLIIKSCGFNVIDVFSHMDKNMLFDGVHPDDAGLEVIAKTVSDYLKDTDVSRVACFGDSITQGVYTEDTWPVKLSRIIYK